MKTSKIALIDMGTNTFHLLIAECYGKAHKPPFKVLFKEKIGVKIGAEGGINAGFISEAAIQRAADTLVYFKSKITEYGVAIENVKAMATSAVRNAKNGSDLTKKIKDLTQISIETISGDQEATLIYKGVCLAMNLGKIPNLIVDIGGGSVEFIIGDSNEIYWKRSFELGGQRLMDKFMDSDPISQYSTMALHHYLHEQLQPLQDAIAQFNPKVMVGVSGTFDTLSEIYLRKIGNFESQQDIEAQSEYALPTEFVLQQAKEFIEQNRAQRMAIEGMIPLRVDMIVVATCLIRYVLQISDIQKIRVSTYSLKEGILSEYL